MELHPRYDRSVRLFGLEGQRALRRTSVAVAGVGGLGSAMAQHLALLGVQRISLIDPEELDDTSFNRFIGARNTDLVPGTLKVTVARRLIQETNPEVEVTCIPHTLLSAEAFRAITASDWAFGCFDDDGPRAVLNELASAYAIPLVDLASDVPDTGIYGGRVGVVRGGDGCLDCMGVLDRRAVRRYLDGAQQRDAEDVVYGIPRDALGAAGPSVSPINAVVAGLAATEFMAAVTGMRPPVRHVEYRGWESKVVAVVDPPRPGCAVCAGIYNTRENADVDRYLRR